MKIMMARNFGVNYCAHIILLIVLFFFFLVEEMCLVFLISAYLTNLYEDISIKTFKKLQLNDFLITRIEWSI